MPDFDALIQTETFRDNPYPVYQQLRAKAPVFWSEAWGCWVLTRYREVFEIIQDFKRFSNRDRVTNVIRQAYPQSFQGQIQSLLSHFKQGLINADPPDHTRLRRLIQKAFLPRTLEALKPKIETWVHRLLDDAASRKTFDLVRDLTFPLPVQVIAELLGVPGEMQDRFKDWSTRILEFQSVPKATPEMVLRSQEALMEMREYFRDFVESRRKKPQEDLTSELVRVEEEGQRLTLEELLSTGVSLLVAGHETTTNLIASTVYALLRNPDQLHILQANPGLLPVAVEEGLRFESPLQRLGRTVLEDVEIGGQQIRKGQTVLNLLGAANRDPDQFDDPDRFWIQRHPNKHVAFGYGIHFCLGAGLARIEAPIAIRVLFERFPHLELMDEPLTWNSGVMRGLNRLPLCVS